MANYLDFLRVLDREKVPRKFTYVCGREKVLVESVVDMVRQAVHTDPMNKKTLFVGKDSTAAIWSEMSQFAADPTTTRLVTVRDAHKLTGWDNFDKWMLGAKGIPIHVLMVADESSWPKSRAETARERMVKSSLALYVECNLPQDDAIGMATRICMEWSPVFWEDKRVIQKKSYKNEIYLSPSGQYLVEKTGCNLARCRDVCRWLNLTGIRQAPSKALIDAFAGLGAQEDFLWSLLRMDKVGAMAAMREVDQHARVILAVLGQRLNELDRLNRAMSPALARHGSFVEAAMRDASRTSGLTYATVKSLWGLARHYDAQAIRERSELLVALDEHSNEDEVLAVLVAEW